MIAGMSHDLKSPLTAIRAYTEGLLEGVAQDEETRQRYLQTIAAIERDYLELSGYEVTVCGDGITGLAALGPGVIAVVALSIRAIRAALQKYRPAMIWFILGLMLGSLYAIAMGPASLQVPQPPVSAATFRPLAFLLGVGRGVCGINGMAAGMWLF